MKRYYFRKVKLPNPELILRNTARNIWRTETEGDCYGDCL
jgi:hypothetical protein